MNGYTLEFRARRMFPWRVYRVIGSFKWCVFSTTRETRAKEHYDDAVRTFPTSGIVARSDQSERPKP